MPDFVDDNAVLISSTMLSEVSALLQCDAWETLRNPRWRGRIRGTVRVPDLLSLIDATVLHDTLYAIPSRSSHEVSGLALRARLLDEGILRELDTRSVHVPIARSILNGLAATTDPVRVAGSASEIGTPITFASKLQEDIEEFLLVLDATKRNERQARRAQLAAKYGSQPQVPPMLDDADDYIGVGGVSSRVLHADSFGQMARALIGWLDYRGSGAYEHCTSILRDMYCVVAAETYSLPYLPQSTRRKFTTRFPNYFDSRTSNQLYSALARAFKSTVAEIVDDHKEEIVLVPPFAALVLDRSANPEDIPARLIEVRSEYAPLRQKLGALESERRAATSIGDRLKVRKAQRVVLGEHGSAFGRPSRLSLEGIVRYIPEVVKPAAPLTDPTQYSASLLLLPANELVAWWRRRPIALLLDVAQRLTELRAYSSRLNDFFGDVD